MEIQSLSICVPAGCPNNCKFCVSRMRRETYVNKMEKDPWPYRPDFKRRLQFCRDNGCHTVVLTGYGEPLLNMTFLDLFAQWNQELHNPFQRIELQTSGVTLDAEKLLHLRHTFGISTLALSISDIFNHENNREYNQTPPQSTIHLDQLCTTIKNHDLNLRLSLNMTDAYNTLRDDPWESVDRIFKRCKELGANQVTFRILYQSGENTPQDEWIGQHAASPMIIRTIRGYIRKIGRELEVLPFGARRYSVDGMSTVVDDDCMSAVSKECLRYAVLRPDCKLYSKWDDQGSLIF